MVPEFAVSGDVWGEALFMLSRLGYFGLLADLRFEGQVVRVVRAMGVTYHRT